MQLLCVDLLEGRKTTGQQLLEFHYHNIEFRLPKSLEDFCYACGRVAAIEGINALKITIAKKMLPHSFSLFKFATNYCTWQIQLGTIATRIKTREILHNNQFDNLKIVH